MLGAYTRRKDQEAVQHALDQVFEMLLLDEPSMGLAPLVVRNIAEVMKINMALRIAHRGYMLENGKLVMEGLSSELRNNEKVKKAYIGV